MAFLKQFRSDKSKKLGKVKKLPTGNYRDLLSLFFRKNKNNNFDNMYSIERLVVSKNILSHILVYLLCSRQTIFIRNLW